MKRVQFVEAVRTAGFDPAIGNTEDEYAYKEGDVVELDDRRANRWIRRGKAVPTAEQPAPAPAEGDDADAGEGKDDAKGKQQPAGKKAADAGEGKDAK